MSQDRLAAILKPFRSGAGGDWFERSPRARLCLLVAVAVLGALVCLPAVGSELAWDDFIMALAARASSLDSYQGAGRDLFAFANGNVADNRQLMDRGLLLPWWSDPELKIAFFRPLSSLLHRLDYVLWFDDPRPMYVHSLLWLGAMHLAVGALYLRFHSSPGLALFATALFVLNDDNGAAVGWLSNRNVLIGVAFCALMLRAHHRSIMGGRSASPATLLWLLAGFAVGEIGIIGPAYLGAYALAYDTRSLRRRARSLAGPFLLTCAWQLLYRTTGAGVERSGVYLHPANSPSEFLSAFPGRALALVGAALGPGPADIDFLGAPAERQVALSVGAAACLLTSWLAFPSLRTCRALRFWALGALLSTVPLTASFASDRLLPVVNLGLMPLVAAAVWVGLRKADAALGYVRQAGAVLLLALHAVVGPALLPIQALRVQLAAGVNRQSFSCLSAVRDLEEKTLVVLGAPTDFWVSYLQAALEWRGRPAPRNVVWVANPGGFVADLSGEGSALLTAADGFFNRLPARLYRPRDRPFVTGEVFHPPGVTIEVLQLNDALDPTTLLLTFDQALDSGAYAFIVWGDAGYENLPVVEFRGKRTIETRPIFATVLSRLQ